jgi:hypothetical protein
VKNLKEVFLNEASITRDEAKLSQMMHRSQWDLAMSQLRDAIEIWVDDSPRFEDAGDPNLSALEQIVGSRVGSYDEIMRLLGVDDKAFNEAGNKLASYMASVEMQAGDLWKNYKKEGAKLLKAFDKAVSKAERR